MATATLEPQASCAPPATPRGLHHIAFVTHDTQATVDFYQGILQMPLVATVINTEIAHTHEPFPYMHLFFRMWDGSTIAFFESPGLPLPAAESDPAYGIFKHLALEVGSKTEVDRWKAFLTAKDVDVVGPKEHGIIYSIYLHDPSGHRLELTTSLTDAWQKGGATASDDIRRWGEAKQQAHGDVAALREWLMANRKYPGKITSAEVQDGALEEPKG